MLKPFLFRYLQKSQRKDVSYPISTFPMLGVQKYVFYLRCNHYLRLSGPLILS